MKSTSRYYCTAGITIQVDSDYPLADETFSPNISSFEIAEPKEVMVRIEHHFGLPNIEEQDLGRKVVERENLTIYRHPDKWIFFCTLLDNQSNPLQQVAFVHPSFTHLVIFNERDDIFRDGHVAVLSFSQTDQLFITRVLATCHGCMFHASGVDLEGEGLLFPGHSTAGKSTMVKMLAGKAKILCDDRIIVRKDSAGFRIHGTWHHGEVSIVSPDSAPLKAILLLDKAATNRLLPIHDKTQLISRLSACTIKAIRPLGTADWWHQTLAVINDLIKEVPCRSLEFDKSGAVVDLLREFTV